MLLERKRIIRAAGTAADGHIPYLHSATKQSYLVPVLDLQPAHIIQVSASLDLLVG